MCLADPFSRFALLVALLLSAATTSAGEPREYTLLDSRGGRLELAVDSAFGESGQGEILHWIGSIADSLASVYGHWPRRHWRIAVQQTSGAASDPIPWAQVNRDDIDEVRFYVIAKTSGDALKQEWTGYHELAHLLIPYRGWGDTWFSEGLASYYQNLLQARSGIITEQLLWQRLHEGFQRGRDDHRFDGVALRLVSDRMRSEGGFMRVYWSGAWYFLAADLELRSNSRGEKSLDSTLQQLNHCCANRAMSVPEMIRELDKLSEVTTFSRLYDLATDSTAVPAYEELYRQLGLQISDNRVTLGGDPEQARLRREFTR